MSSYYSNGGYTSNMCNKCGHPSHSCGCGITKVEPNDYIKKISTNDDNIVRSFSNRNEVITWRSAVITDVTKVGDEIVIVLTDGTRYTIPLYKGLSEGEILELLRCDYYTKSEINNMIRDLEEEHRCFVTRDEVNTLMACKCQESVYSECQVDDMFAAQQLQIDKNKEDILINQNAILDLNNRYNALVIRVDVLESSCEEITPMIEDNITNIENLETRVTTLEGA